MASIKRSTDSYNHNTIIIIIMLTLIIVKIQEYVQLLNFSEKIKNQMQTYWPQEKTNPRKYNIKMNDRNQKKKK